MGGPRPSGGCGRKGVELGQEGNRRGVEGWVLDEAQEFNTEVAVVEGAAVVGEEHVLALHLSDLGEEVVIERPGRFFDPLATV